ncbi:MAG TPA: hypothetical protein VFK88_02035 [Gallionella sp.]|nr:hypothetical protein [Gallionella sp.]
MRRPSFFVSALIVSTGAFFVLSFLLMRQLAPAIGSFIFFFFFWAVLQSVGRDPTVKDPTARWYFRFVILMGALAMTAALLSSFLDLINGQYRAALRSFGPFILLAATAWRFRKEWIGWLRKNET